MKTLKQFLAERGDALKVARMEVAKTNVDAAYEWGKSVFIANNKDIDNELPNFHKNYMLAKRKAGLGKTKRKDMPVIRSRQVKEFQTRLMMGFVDVQEPWGNRTDPNDPFPDGLSGKAAEQFMRAGLKVFDGNDKDDRVRAVRNKVAVNQLKPIQKQIFVDKVLANVARDGTKSSIEFLTATTLFITSADNFIIDGHHRFLTSLLIDPKMPVSVLQIDLPISKLLPLTLAYGDAMGNKRNVH